MTASGPTASSNRWSTACPCTPSLQRTCYHWMEMRITCAVSVWLLMRRERKCVSSCACTSSTSAAWTPGYAPTPPVPCARTAPSSDIAGSLSVVGLFHHTSVSFNRRITSAYQLTRRRISGLVPYACRRVHIFGSCNLHIKAVSVLVENSVYRNNAIQWYGRRMLYSRRAAYPQRNAATTPRSCKWILPSRVRGCSSGSGSCSRCGCSHGTPPHPSSSLSESVV